MACCYVKINTRAITTFGLMGKKK